jgi:hypothetical protein
MTNEEAARGLSAGEDAAGRALWEAMRMVRGSGDQRQLGTRISKEAYDLLTAVAEATDFKQNALLEFAILRTFGTKEGRELWQGK